MKLAPFAIAVTLALTPAVIFAQSAPNRPDPTINQRRENQQDRIANGIVSGQLTAGETRNVESRESNLNREVRDDRSADNGRLTQQERQQINHQQNNLSHSIYQDKHNANVAHYGNNEVGQRRENQQDRPHCQRYSQWHDECRADRPRGESRARHQ